MTQFYCSVKIIKWKGKSIKYGKFLSHERGVLYIEKKCGREIEGLCER